ncbi:Microtubule-associated protein futsch like protein [Argiope bruennichi]|uniref:Microtubule-associated protein futsch like protein n=1 Tax=Argiope bruennichi TaxID=94029 RepID=A0A8T0FX16_ARGBR|nr:Microtubule-associated protein futsch like protein [Argiope bruennichi]
MPSPVEETKDKSTPVEEKLPTPIKEKTPSPMEEKAPSPVEERNFHPPFKMKKPQHQLKKQSWEDKKVPLKTEEERIPIPIKEKVSSPIEEKAPLPVEEQKIPSQVKEDKAPSPVKEERLTSPVKEEKAPSPVEEEKAPSPIEEAMTTSKTEGEKIPTPIKEEKAPSTLKKKAPSPLEEQTIPTPVKEEKAPSPVQETTVPSIIEVEKIPTPIEEKKALSQMEEKASSPLEEQSFPPAPSKTEEEIITTPIKEKAPSTLEEKAPSPVEDQKIPSPVKVEKAPSSVKEKAPSPVKEEKAPSPIEETKVTTTIEDENIPTPIEEKKAPSPIQDKAPSPVKEQKIPLLVKEEKAPSPVEELKPPSTTEEEKIPAPTKEEKTPSPMVEKVPSPVEEQKIPSLVKEYKAASPIEEMRISAPTEEEKIPTPVKDGKTPSPVVESKALLTTEKEKIPTPIKKEKAPSPMEEKASSPVEDQKIPSPVKEYKAASPIEEMRISSPTDEAKVPAEIEEKICSYLAVDKKITSPVEDAKVPSAAEEKTFASPTEEEKSPSPTQEKKISSPVKEAKAPSAIEETKVPSPTEGIKVSSEPEEEKTLSPVQEVTAPTTAEEEKIPSPIKEDKTPSPIEKKKVSSPVEEEKASSPIEEAKVSTPAEDAKAPSGTEEKKISSEMKEEKAPLPFEKIPSPVKTAEAESPEDEKDKLKMEIDSKVSQEDFLSAVSKKINDYESLLNELEEECDFPSGTSSSVLYNTICTELGLKKITITVENIIKYIIEHRIEILTIIKTKYSKIKSVELTEKKITDKKESSKTEDILTEKLSLKEVHEKHVTTKLDEDRKSPSPLDEEKPHSPTEEKQISSIESISLVEAAEKKKIEAIQDAVEEQMPVEKEPEKKITDFDSKALQEAFLIEAAKQIKDYESLLKELDDNCDFPCGNSATVLYDTVCFELSVKKITITVESIIKYIIEYRIEIITIIKRKYSKIKYDDSKPKEAEKSTVVEQISEDRHSIHESILPSSDYIMDRNIFDQTYDEDIISPIAESVMGEEIYVHEDEIEMDQDDIIKPKSARDTSPSDAHKDKTEFPKPKTLYEKPESEQVFRHIFAETIVDDESEILQDKISAESEISGEISMKDDDDDKMDEPESPRKKLMYVEIEIEESVTSTTDASPDTDAPEIPYDGKYKEQVEKDIIVKEETSESVQKIAEDGKSTELMKSTDEKVSPKLESKSEPTVSPPAEVASNKLDSRESKIVKESTDVSKPELMKSVQETTTAMGTESEIQEDQQKIIHIDSTEDGVKEIEIGQEDTDKSIHFKTEKHIDMSTKDRISPELVPTEIKTEETSFVLKTSDMPSSSEVSKILTTTSITEGDSTVSETKSKIISSKVVSSDISEETSAITVKTEKEEDAFETITTITTTKIIKSDDLDHLKETVTKEMEKVPDDSLSFETPRDSEILESLPKERGDIEATVGKTVATVTTIKIMSLDDTDSTYKVSTEDEAKAIADELKRTEPVEEQKLITTKTEIEDDSPKTSEIQEVSKEDVSQDIAPPTKEVHISEKSTISLSDKLTGKDVKTDSISLEEEVVATEIVASPKEKDAEEKGKDIKKVADAGVSQTKEKSAESIEDTIDSTATEILSSDEQSLFKKVITTEKIVTDDDSDFSKIKVESRIITTKTVASSLDEEGHATIITSEKDIPEEFQKLITDEKFETKETESDSRSLDSLSRDITMVEETVSETKTTHLAKPTVDETKEETSITLKGETETLSSETESSHKKEKTDEFEIPTITKAITTVTRTLVMPSDDLDMKSEDEKSFAVESSTIRDEQQIIQEEIQTSSSEIVTETITKEILKSPIEKKDSGIKTSITKKESESPSSDAQETHLTEEMEVIDGEPVIRTTVTTITRKIVIPADEIDEKSFAVASSATTTSEQEICHETKTSSEEVTETTTTEILKSPIEKTDSRIKTSITKTESESPSSDAHETHLKEEMEVIDGDPVIKKTVTTITRKIVVPAEDFDEESFAVASSITTSSGQQISHETKTSSEEVTETTTTEILKSPTEKTDSEIKTSTMKTESESSSADTHETRLTEEMEVIDGDPVIRKTITTITRKIVVPAEDFDEESFAVATTSSEQQMSQKTKTSPEEAAETTTTEILKSPTEKIDSGIKTSTMKTGSESPSSDAHETRLTEEMEVIDGEPVIRKTITTITRKIVVPAEDFDEESFAVASSTATSSEQQISQKTKTSPEEATETTTTEILKSSTERIDSDIKTSTMKTESESPSSDAHETRLTEEMEVIDGDPVIRKTITTITRKIVVPAEDFDEESFAVATTSSEQQISQKTKTSPEEATETTTTEILKSPTERIDSGIKTSTMKTESESPSSDAHETRLSEEMEVIDGEPVIRKTITTITRKIVVPTEEIDEKSFIITSSATSDEQQKFEEVKTSASETLAETTVTDVLKSPIEKADYHTTVTTKTASIPDYSDIHLTKEMEETDGEPIVTKTVTTITRKIIIPADGSDDIPLTTTYEQEDKSEKETKIGSEIVAETTSTEIPKQKSEKMDEQFITTSETVPEADVIHQIDETERTDETPIITKTVTTITRKIVMPSEDVDDKSLSSITSTASEEQDMSSETVTIQKVKSLSKGTTDETVTESALGVSDIYSTDETETIDGQPVITKTVTVTRKIIMPAEENDEQSFTTITSSTTTEERDDIKVDTKTSSSSSATTIHDEKSEQIGEFPVTVKTTIKTTVHEDSDSTESVVSEKSTISKRVEDKEHMETKSDSMTVMKIDSSTERTEHHSENIEERQISSTETKTTDKKSDMQTQDSISKSCATTKSSLQEHEISSDSTSQSFKTTSQEIIKKELSDTHSTEGTSEDFEHKIITKTCLSEATEIEDSHTEITSKDSTISIVKTSKIITEPDEETDDTRAPRTRLSSEDDPTDELSSPGKTKSKRKEHRTVKKKIIVYQTETGDSAEDILTEDKIREAIIEAGGKQSSKSHIISFGTVDDLESFSGQENILELRSKSTTPVPEDENTTSKVETVSEKLESIEIDPFSLITKPIEETFRKKISEQHSSTTSETRQETMKETSHETIEEISFDKKVATDAKKLAMEISRQTRERTESTQSETHERTSSASTTETSLVSESRTTSSTSHPSQSERDEDEGKKTFSLDEWGKPMGLPSPPEPLDFETDLSTLSKQKTTHTTKQEGSYTENKADVSTEQQNNTTDLKSGTEKSNKETDSVSEQEYNHQGHKTGEGSTEPVYIDLTYVPHFGDPHYCNVEFFRRIRSRYYVFSGTKPSKEVFNALLEAKQDWKDKDAKVTIIPTYETDTLGYWMAVNQEALIANNIDVAPSASRCTINLQDHETSCSAYRLEL